MNESELLKYIENNNIIDLTYVLGQMEMDKKKKYLEKHPYDIWKGKDNAWYTYFSDDKGRGRKLKRRVSKEKLEEDIINYYKAREENPCIIDLFEKWNNERLELGEIHENSHTKYENDFKRFFKKTDDFCQVPVKKITEADLQEFIKMNIIRYNLSRKSYAGLRTLLMGIFKYAKLHKLTEISISTFFNDLQLSKNLFKKKKKDDSMQVFTDDEVDKLKRYFVEHPTIHNYGLLLLFETGMRVGELCVLRPDSITRDGIVIDSTEVYYKDPATNKEVFAIKEGPKMDGEIRTIVIREHTRSIIKKIRLMNPFGEYLFMLRGKRINSTRFNYHLYKACDALGIPRRSTHKIRKTYASRLIDSGVEESIIKTQMGHTDFKTTKEYYYYSTHNQKYKEEQISRALGQTI